MRQLMDDPLGVVLDVLKTHRTPMGKADIKAALVKAGAAERVIDSKWRDMPAKLKAHEHVLFKGNKYQWSEAATAAPEPEEPTPARAVERLVKGVKLKADERRKLGTIVLSALEGQSKPRVIGRAAAVEEAERQRHLETKLQGNFVRTLADLAMDLEELIGNEASAYALVDRIRTTAQAHGLEPIGNAGEATAFDGQIHHPIAGSLTPGASVIVMRPGYFFRAGKDEVLLAKALVFDQ